MGSWKFHSKISLPRVVYFRIDPILFHAHFLRRSASAKQIAVCRAVLPSKSANVLDAGGTDSTQFVAPLPLTTIGLCAWQWWIAQPHHVTDPVCYASVARNHSMPFGKPSWLPLLHAPLTGNHRGLSHQRCDVQRTTDIVFTDESRFCLQHPTVQFGDTLGRGLRCASLHRSRIMVWGGIGFLSRTPLVRIAGPLNSSEVLEPYIQCSHIPTGK
ncbi:transposable element Tcb1 transposase [Trichonephila clavipes]|nr:transposable element Tcb1 transposase [Trichonephila clavipes]